MDEERSALVVAGRPAAAAGGALLLVVLVLLVIRKIRLTRRSVGFILRPTFFDLKISPCVQKTTAAVQSKRAAAGLPDASCHHYRGVVRKNDR